MRSIRIASRTAGAVERVARRAPRFGRIEQAFGCVHTVVAIAGLLAGMAAGCTVSQSLSDSSGSIAGSVSGISQSTSDSISRSSDSSRSGGGTDAAAQAFQRDVTVYTAVFVESGGSRASYVNDLTRIAAGHGISEWWADPATYRAIGLGLKRGGLDEAGVSRFAHDVFGGNARATEELLHGHRS